MDTAAILAAFRDDLVAVGFDRDEAMSLLLIATQEIVRADMVQVSEVSYEPHAETLRVR